MWCWMVEFLFNFESVDEVNDSLEENGMLWLTVNVRWTAIDYDFLLLATANVWMRSD